MTSETQALISDLNRAKVAFQLRAVCASMNLNVNAVQTRCAVCGETNCDHTDFDWRNASAAGVTPSTTPATFSETDPAKAWVGEIENTPVHVNLGNTEGQQDHVV